MDPVTKEVIGHQFSTSQVIARSLVSAGLSYGTTKGLEGLGLNPTLSALAGGFIGVGFLGAGAGLSGFIKSGLQNLLLQGVSILGLKLNLPPPIAGAISLVTGAALQSYFDPSLTLKQAITQIAPKVAEKLVLGGLDLLGRSLGLDPRITALIGLPISASIGGLVDGIANGTGPGSIFNSIKNALTSSQTLGGLVSVGANIGLDAIGAPPILQSFIPNLLGNLVSGIGGGSSGGGGPPDAKTTGENLFKKITDGIAKFGRGILSAGQQVISFGAKVIEGIGSLTKAGFAKAGEFFAGIFDRKTIEDLTNNGTRSVESALNDHCSVLAQGIHCAYKEIEIDYLLTDDRLSYKNSGIDTTFGRLDQVGGFFSGNIAFAQEAGPDGVRLVQDYEGGKLNSVKIFDDLDMLLEINPFSEHIPLSFENDVLISGKMSLNKFGVDISVLDGQLQSLNQSFDYSSIGFTDISKNIQISAEADGGSGLNINISPLDGFDIGIENNSIILEGLLSQSPSTNLTEIVNEGIQNLGVYRDPDIIGIYPDDPVIIEYTDVVIKSGLVGIFEPKKGLVGTTATGQLMEGSIRITAYGTEDSAGVKNPTSWQIAIWAPTGEQDPVTGWSRYGWRILTEEEAKNHPIAIAHGIHLDQELEERFNNFKKDGN